MNLNFISELVKVAASKGAAAVRSSRPRLDANLPMGMQIGAFVKFDDIPFLLAKGAGHLVGEKPDTQRIVAVGLGKIADVRFHRFYLEGGEHYLQTVVDPSNQLIAGEFKLYRREREWFPQSIEEWGVWVHANDDPDDLYRIGFQTFDLPDAADQSRTISAYARLWPNPGHLAPQVEPVMYEERIYSDPFAETANMLVRHQAMLYGRQTGKPGTPGPDEWLLLEESERGPRDNPSEAFVTAHIGFAIEDASKMLVAA